MVVIIQATNNQQTHTMPTTTRSMQMSRFFQMIENYSCWDVEMPEIMATANLLGIKFQDLDRMTPEMRNLSIGFYDWVETQTHLRPDDVAFRAFYHYNPCTFEIYSSETQELRAQMFK